MVLRYAISEHDTLRPLGIQFRPFANSARDTKHHKHGDGVWEITIVVEVYDFRKITNHFLEDYGEYTSN